MQLAVAAEASVAVARVVYMLAAVEGQRTLAVWAADSSAIEVEWWENCSFRALEAVVALTLLLKATV